MVFLLLVLERTTEPPIRQSTHPDEEEHVVAAKTDRNEEILEAVLEGAKYLSLAERFDITVARVGQLVEREARRNPSYRKALREARTESAA